MWLILALLWPCALVRADGLPDLGPEGGGRIIATGAPETVAAMSGSHTGRYLAPLLAKVGAGGTVKKKVSVFRD